MLIDHRNAGPEILGGHVAPGDMARGFLACSINRTGLPVLSVLNGQNIQVDFDTVAYDVGGWFDIGSPTILTVPEGVTRVRVYASMIFTGTFGANNTVFIDGRLNAAANTGFGRTIYPPITGVFNEWGFATAPFAVVPGDTLGVSVNASNINSSLSVFGSIEANFAAEAVTAS